MGDVGVSPMLQSRHGQLYCVRRNKFSDLYYVIYCMGGDAFSRGTVNDAVDSDHRVSPVVDSPESLARFTSS